MSVNIHGKEYRTVAERINLFYERYNDKITAITTEVVKDEKNIVQVKATISAKDKIENPTFFVFGNGFAEEDRTKGRINSTSALENCETSAIGRALASIGLGGEEYASANEVENARHQQKQSTDGTITKDDGSQFPQQQPKRNTDLTEALQNQVDKAKSQMNGESNGNGNTKDSVCNFKKYKGMQWSEVALIDTVDDEGKAEIGTDYMKWIKTNVKDLDTDTLEILNQYIA